MLLCSVLYTLSSAGWFGPPANTPTQVRDTEYGKVVGVKDGSDLREKYLGIPFADPPTGNNRFRAPQPHSDWSDVLTCTTTSSKRACLQSGKGREDCLYLDVHVPAGSDGQKLPVWLWIYGGGFVGGNKDSSMYDPYAIMDQHRVVFVAINYRLDVFGFMAHPAFEEESETGKVSGNYGLLDQTFALRWVQKNIANFNGNPDNVMVFGQSAGGMSVEFHVVSHASKGIFKSAIIMSGPPDVAFWQPKPVANKWALDWAETAGCGESLGSNEKIRQCLRSQSSYDIMKDKIPHPNDLSLLYPLMGWMPNIDGFYLTNTPVGMVQAGQWNEVPTMFGVEKNEGTIFVLATPMVLPGTFPMTYSGLEDISKQIFPHNATKGKMVYEHYYQRSGLGEEYFFANDAADVLYTDLVVRCGTRRMLRAIAAKNLPHAPTYFYYTNYEAPLMAAWQALGDFHGFDLVHVFEYDVALMQVWDSGNTALGKFYRQSFFEFGNYGSPGHEAWVPYTTAEEKGVYMNGEFNAQNMNHEGPEAKECDFWDSIGANLWEGKNGYTFVPVKNNTY